MDEDGTSASSNKRKVTVNYSSSLAMKSLQFPKFLKPLVLLSAIAFVCIMCFASCNNVSRSNLPTLSIFPLYSTNNGTSSTSTSGKNDLDVRPPSTSGTIDLDVTNGPPATSEKIDLDVTNGPPSTSSGKTDLDDVVHDENYELRKVLKAASMEDKTVLLTTLNDAWAKPNSLFDIFLEGIRTGNDTSKLLKHLVVVAVDEKAYDRCKATVSHCYFLKTNIARDVANEAKFMSPTYLKMMWARHDLLYTILKLGHNFLFTDTDVVFFRDPFPHFFPDDDFQTSSDDFNGNPYDMDNHPNNGLVFVRSNNRTIELYRYWIESKKRFPRIHEQNVFNRIKCEGFIKQIGLKYRFLDTEYFGGFCSPSNNFDKVRTMHANCCTGIDTKIFDLTIMIEDWKNYASSSWNKTVSQKPYWRVPDKCGRIADRRPRKPERC